MVILKLARKIENDLSNRDTKSKVKYDFNNDGKFNKKDARIAGKALNKYKRRK